MPTDPAVLVRLTQALAGVEPVESYPLRLCHAFVSLVEAMGGGISLGATTAERSMLCATDDEVLRFEEAQDLLGQGPSVDALHTGRPSVPTDIADQGARWPRLASNLPAIAGARLVRAFPMRPHAAVAGVLTLHQWPVAGEDPVLRNLDEVAALADAVGTAILGATGPEGTDDRLWGERDRVSQATGMVVAQLRLQPADALAVLRAHAFAHETTLAQVSALVLERKLDFSNGLRGDL